MNAQTNSKENPHPEVQLTRKELGDAFNISESTIKREKSLKPLRKNSRVILYTKQDVDRLIQLGYNLDLLKAQAYQIPLPPLPGLSPKLKNTEGFSANVVNGEPGETELLVELVRMHLRNKPSAKAHLLRFLGELLTSGPLDQVA